MDFSKVKEFIDTMEKRGIPTCELIVTKDGKEVFNHRVGFSDNSKDLYWLYSTSKLITCTCAMRLIEEGKMSLSDPVSKYIPSFANFTVRDKNGDTSPCKTVMTIEHLFTMTSGIGNEHENGEIVRNAINKKGADTLSVIDAMSRVPLYFEPGTRYQYGLSHDVLAGVVEIVSGMKFSQYVKENILDPLGMDKTGFHPDKDTLSHFIPAHRYDNSIGASEEIPIFNWLEFTPDYDSGGAGIYSCAADYIKFLKALSMGGLAENGYRLLTEESIKQMETNRLCKEALSDFVNGRLYGYGWGLCGRVHTNPDFSLSKSSVGEFGWDGAGGCFSMVDRKKGVSLFFGMHVLGCNYSYVVLQSVIRNLVYNALD